MWVLVATTITEICMFTVLQTKLFDGDHNELVFNHMENLSTGVKIFIIDFVAAFNMIIFIYFSAVAYEYYSIACDDPKMIDAEHKRRANLEKQAAADRKKRKEEA